MAARLLCLEALGVRRCLISDVGLCVRVRVRTQRVRTRAVRIPRFALGRAHYPLTIAYPFPPTAINVMLYVSLVIPLFRPSSDQIPT
jgi:hypothetical protein